MFKPTVMAFAGAMILAGQAHSNAQLPTLPAVMRDKLENAQNLLRPVVLGDLAGVDRYAERLGRLTYTEIGSWQARADSDYLKQANAFVEAVQGLRVAATAHDAKAAFTAYTSLISSCVNCHRLARNLNSVSLFPLPEMILPPAPTRAEGRF